MLRTYNLTKEERFILFSEMSHPDVSPYVRNYVDDFNEYLKSVPHILEAEERGEMVVRVIMNEWGKPIGMISLYDITEYGGFLSTWLGKSYHGKGYNKIAKELFLNKVFYDYDIQTVFMKIKVDNIRSQKAALKLAYVTKAEADYHAVHTIAKKTEKKYYLFTVTRRAYLNDQMKRKINHINEFEEYSMHI